MRETWITCFHISYSANVRNPHCRPARPVWDNHPVVGRKEAKLPRSRRGDVGFEAPSISMWVAAADVNRTPRFESADKRESFVS